MRTSIPGKELGPGRFRFSFSGFNSNWFGRGTRPVTLMGGCRLIYIYICIYSSRKNKEHLIWWLGFKGFNWKINISNYIYFPCDLHIWRPPEEQIIAVLPS